MKKTRFVSVLTLLLASPSFMYAQPVSRNIKTPEYRELQRKLCSGWNTWYNGSFTSHVHLPQGFSINLCLTQPGNPDYLKETFKEPAISNRPEKVLPGLRADDGSYTSMKLTYKEEELSIQSATDGADELILVSPGKKSKNYLVVEAGLLWNLQGSIGMHNNGLFGMFPEDTIEVHTTASPVEDAYAVTTAPHLTFTLDNEIGIYTGKTRTLPEIKAIIQKHRDEEQKRMDSHGDLASSFTAMQTILAWNTIYDAPNHRVITPVSRSWSNGWGGFVLFDWDTYFASYMLSSFNKDLAYANAVEITKSITPDGFIPNYQSPFGNTSWDRSEPPVGSAIILWIYNKYKEKWFLNEVYDELLTWNRWWASKRDVKGYLCWGSTPVPDSLKSIEKNNLQAAKFESGLDNSPMYDSIPFSQTTHTMELADVGLMSMYIADCNSLAEISTILGKKAEAAELNKRASFYTRQLAGMWDEKTGIFLNKRLDNGEKSYRLSPTNFYPMLAKACTEKQAERMIKEHYYNPDEFYGKYVIPSISRNNPAFKDNDYWRGRIWGPMNFLVYMGMRNYHLPEARLDLISKSKALLMQNWKADGGVYENYNSVTGTGGDVHSADGFYHWGALLTFIEFVERGL
ncbi:MAG: trehalase family glycosidase [Bacteroidota bacterium]|nr:trehalase family glycosidase [Bacteroidota bacterium]